MTAKKRITVRMSSSLNELLTTKASRLGISKNALVIQILWEKIGGLSNE